MAEPDYWLPLLPLRPEPALGDGLQPDTSAKEQQVTTFATEGSAAQQAAVADEVSGDVTAQITNSNSQSSAALYASHALSMWGQARSCEISLLVVLTHDAKSNRLVLLSSTTCSGRPCELNLNNLTMCCCPVQRMWEFVIGAPCRSLACCA